MKIRRGRPDDASALARLAGQLGYPASKKELESRLSSILNDERHALFVAEDKQQGIVGWVHVLIYQLLVMDRMALVGGLVVDVKFRRQGIGRLLMKEAESWARATACVAASVKSNANRVESHPFYVNAGFQLMKTQYAFLKELGT